MGEISSMLEEMRAFLQARLPQAQVGLAHPGDQRPFPPKRPRITVGLEQLALRPLGCGDRGGAKRLCVVYRIALCSPQNGSQCTALGEQAADALMAAPGFFIEEILWGEVKFQREAGGFLLVIKVRCAYIQRMEEQAALPIERVELTARAEGLAGGDEGKEALQQ